MIHGDVVIVAQAFALLFFLLKTTFTALFFLPYALVRCLTSPKVSTDDDVSDRPCVFYEGTVYHIRRKPVVNSFRYPVRMAVVDLDHPPSWWGQQASDHMTADEARQFATTEGQVLLLTTPVSAGYAQNPISVYYCKGAEGTLQTCIAEVTNTPWGARVTFLFRPQGQDVPKAMHVSPLMDMDSTWHIRAPLPGKACSLEVSATHPQLGRFFEARLSASRSRSAERSDFAGLPWLWRYGLMPHRVAFWIYWQALRLLWKGVPFYGYPGKEHQAEAAGKAQNPKNSEGRHFRWRDPLDFPWNAT